MSNPLTAEAVKSICENINNYEEVEWRGYSFVVRHYLSLEEFNQLIDAVIRACMNDEHKTFTLELVDFAFKINVVLRYTNIELPKDIETQHQLIYNTNIYNVIKCDISEEQLDAAEKIIALYLK